MLSFFLFFTKVTKTYWRQAGAVLLILISNSHLYAQKDAAAGALIKGVVLFNNNPVVNATMLLQTPGDASFLKGTITDSTGNFAFPDVKAGKYNLYIQSAGYKIYITKTFTIDSLYQEKILPPVHLDSATVKLLSEVIVKASKPLIERKAGKIIFNVENSTITIGSNAWDILRKTPGVRTNEQGYVSLKAATAASIMLDDKLIELSGRDLADLLSAINSEDVSKIEVIPNPSSVYDAEGTGGLINIVTKKNKQDGFNGAVNTGYEQNTYAKYTTGINLHYKQKKLTASLTHQYKNGAYLTKEYLDQQYNNEGMITLYKETLNRQRKQANNTSKLDLNYDMSKKSTIGFMIDGTWGKWHNKDQSGTPIYSSKNIVDSSYLSDIYNNGDKSYISLNTHYKGAFDTLGRSLNIDFDYLQYNTTLSAVNTNNIFDADHNLIRPATVFRSEVPQLIRIYTAKMDYVHPLGSGTSFSAGAKATKTNTDNIYRFENYINSEYLNDTGKSNHFNYEENIIALYGEVTKTINNFTFQSGLRSENTKTRGNSLTLQNVMDRSYFKIFPTLLLQQKFSDQYQLEFNYGYRINRPSYEDMNPFRYYSTPYSSSSGNPYLKPSYVHSLSLVNIFQNKYVITLYHLQNKDEFLQLPEQDTKTKTIVFKQLNLEKSSISGITMELPFEAGKWWQSYNSIDISRQNVYAPYLGSVYADDKVMATVSSTQAFVVTPHWSAEINVMYQSPGIGGLFRMSSYSEVALGVKRKLLHDKAVISVNISDLFRGTIMSARVNYLDQYSIATTNNDLRGIRVNFSYKFGKAKIKQAEERDAGNKEEQSRINK